MEIRPPSSAITIIITRSGDCLGGREGPLQLRRNVNVGTGVHCKEVKEWDVCKECKNKTIVVVVVVTKNNKERKMTVKESDSALFVAENRGGEDNNSNNYWRGAQLPRVSSWEGYGLKNRK